ncbi:hypothetical protein ACLMJK_001162 [Lecanora helva]
MFFSDYVIQPKESTVGFGFLENLPSLLTKEGGASPARETVSAVALMSLAHRSSCFDYLVSEARQCYGNAMRLLVKALQDPDAWHRDSTLATVLCLGAYETLSGDLPSGTQWTSHLNILEFLLCVRLTNQHVSPESRHLSYNAQFSLQLRNLSQRRRPNKEAMIMLNDADRDPAIKRMGFLVYITCYLLASADELISQAISGQGSLSALSAVTAQGRQLDAQLAEWGANASGNFAYQILSPFAGSCIGRRVSSQDGPTVHLYSSFSMACLWNFHRCTRIMLNRCMTHCVTESEKLDKSSPARTDMPTIQMQLTSLITSLIDDICASVPYLLGEIDQQGNLQRSTQNRAVGGLLLIWPLRVAFDIGCAKPAQKVWIRRQLTYIKNIYGINGAVNDMPAHSWWTDPYQFYAYQSYLQRNNAGPDES